MVLRVLLALGALVSLAYSAQIASTPATFEFTFSQSVTGFRIWTAPTGRRIRNTDITPPAANGSNLFISAAMEEFESFQVIIAPTSAFASMTVSLSAFTGLGPTASTEVDKALFTAAPAAMGTYSVTDYLDVVPQGGSVALSSTQPTVLWITVYIPTAGTVAGTATATLTLTPAGGSVIALPISLYVYNFAISLTPHFDTFMMSQPNPTLTSGLTPSQYVDQLDQWKKVAFQHRMASTYIAWPCGLNDGVAWDCTANAIITGAGVSHCVYANECLVERYALGRGQTDWRGVAYPDPTWIGQGFSMMMLENTSGGRPSKFCGNTCANPTTADGCGAAYEAEWALYIKELGNYVNNASHYIYNKSMWYTVNEPQDWTDYNWAAYLCSLRNTHAPNLRIMLSEEAKPQIAERADVGCTGYDIWWAHINALRRSYTWNRQAIYGETSWFYSLDDDMHCGSKCPGNKVINPTPYATGLNDGMHYRALTFVAFSMRVTGWGYYHDNSFWDDRTTTALRPRVSAALLRETFEDYEYLYQANGNKHPAPWQNEQADDAARSIGFCVSSWLSDYNALATLRHEIGRKVEGTRPDMPWLTRTTPRPVGSYYLDFGNPPGTVGPISARGQSWIPVDFSVYSNAASYGFCGMDLGVNQNAVSYSTATGGDAISNTNMYDAYSNRDEFFFAVANGVYNVTVAIGTPTQPCSQYKEYVEVMGLVVHNTTATCTGTGVREYSIVVQVVDNMLACAFSGWAEHYDATAITVLNYMTVVSCPSCLPVTSAPLPTIAPSTTTGKGSTSSSSSDGVRVYLPSLTVLICVVLALFVL